MMSHFPNKERPPVQISCNIFNGFSIIKEMPGLVGSGTPVFSSQR